jgi:hypothetical protein
MDNKKKCSRCNEIKDFSCYYKHRDGYRPACKLCLSNQQKEYHAKQETKDRLKEYKKRDYVQEKKREYESLEHVKEKKKEYEKIPEVNERIKNWHSKWQRDKYKNDVNFKMKEIIRKRIRTELKKGKTKHSEEYLGCDIDFLRKWLEFRFSDDINWDNYGTYWQIDHILPVSSFDFTIEKNKFICFHWTNLQPLKSNINNSKTNKLQLHYYFNNIVNINRFNTKFNQFLGYQMLNESLTWLRLKLKHGKNSPYDKATKIALKIGNQQPII